MFSISAYAKTSSEWVADGNLQYDAKNYSDALESFDRALEIDANNVDAWNDKGHTLYYLGRYEEAIVAYDKAIAINPDDANTWSSKGYALNNLGRYEEAIKAFDKAIVINPDDAAVWNNKGNALNNLGRYEEAIKAFDKAIAINPDDAHAWILKGYAFNNLGRHEEAIKAFDKAIAINPNDAYAWDNKGIALNGLERYDEAIKAFDKAIAIYTDDADAWHNKGIELSNLGQYEEAIKAYDKTIAINPDNAGAWFDKGIALDSLGKYDEANEAYKMAGDLNPFYILLNAYSSVIYYLLLLSEIPVIIYIIIFVLFLFYSLKIILKKRRNVHSESLTSNSHSAKKSNDTTKVHNLTSEPSRSPSNVTAFPTITSAFGYKGATIQYKVKVENPTPEPIADIKINLYVPDVFLAPESKKSIAMLKPSESKTVTFEIRPTGECGDCEVSGKVVYYDYSTKKTTEIDIPPKSLSIVCPMLKMKEINESEWHNIVSSFVETEESTREIDMPAETMFTMISRIVKDMHMHPLNPEITNSQQLFNGVARFYGEGVKGLKYAAQVEVVGGAKKSRLILKTWAEKEEALTGFYHGLLDEIEKRVSVKGYIDDSIVQNFHHYGDKIGTQVKDSVVQRSNIGIDVADKKCPECGTVAEGNGKFCNGCGGKL